MVYKDTERLFRPLKVNVITGTLPSETLSSFFFLG